MLTFQFGHGLCRFYDFNYYKETENAEQTSSQNRAHRKRIIVCLDDDYLLQLYAAYRFCMMSFWFSMKIPTLAGID